jgi:hypothetical protein
VFYGTGVAGTVLPGGTDSWLPVRITISTGAELGARFFVVMTPRGPLDSTLFNVSFEIVGVIAPTTTRPDFTSPDFTIGPIVTLGPGFTLGPTIGPGFTIPINTIDPGGIVDPGDIVINPGGGLLNPGGILNPGGGLLDPLDIVVDPGGALVSPGGGLLDIGDIAVNPGGAGLFGPGAGGVVAPPTIGLNPRIFASTTGVTPVAGGALHATSAEPGRPVTDVRGIGAASAEKLAAIEITSAEQLADAAPEHVAQILGISAVRAMGFIENARKLVSDRE